MKTNFFLSSLALLIVFGSCKKYVDNIKAFNNGVPINDIFTIASISADSIPADSMSTVTIKIQINQQADSALASVNLITDHGQFTNDSSGQTLRTNLEGSANFILKSGRVPGIVKLRAKVAGRFRDTTILFTTSYPDIASVSTGTDSVSANDSIPFILLLTKYNPYMSRSQFVTSTVSDINGNPRGYFNGNGYMDPSFHVKFMYHPNSTSYRGPVTLTGRIETGSNTFINKNISVVIKN